MKTLFKFLSMLIIILVSQSYSQAIESIDPDSLLKGSTKSISILGQDTHFMTGNDQTDSVWISLNGNYIFSSDITVYDESHLDAVFQIPSDTETGKWDLFVTQTTGYSTLDSSEAITIYKDENPPPSPPDSGITFTKIIGENVTDAGPSKNCAWGDYDNDGFLDLYVVNYRESNYLYHNNTNNTFTFVNFSNRSRASYSCSWGDYDNDGDLDIFIANYSEDNLLYKNIGNGQFDEINNIVLSNDLGKSKDASWCDYDCDGYIDLYVSNTSSDFLYKNTGDGNFNKIESDNFNIENYSVNCIWGDYNNDGNMDIFISSSRSDNLLYKNNGDGSFEKIQDGDIVNNGGRTYGASWGDYNNDGYLDLFVPNTDIESFLYRNNGDGTFTKVSGSGLTEINGYPRDCKWGDYNNDGYLDMFITDDGGDSHNFLYKNNGDGTFSFDTSAYPSKEGNSSTCTWGDYNNDGYLDLYVCNYRRENYLYKNNGNDNNWIIINLKGNISNTYGLGARINVKAKIDAKHTWQLREITDKSSLRAHFGLGKASIIDSLVINWPSGIQQILTNVNVNQILEVEEPEQSITSKFCLKTNGPIEGGISSINSNNFYAPSSNDKIYRFDSTGTVEYTLSVNGEIKSSSTITSDNTVYIASTDNNLYSFNSNGVSNTGWPISLGAEATASVAVDDDKNIYIGTQNGIFQAVSPNGNILWSYNVGAAVFSSAVISKEQKLYVINYNGRIYAFDLESIDQNNVQYIWKYDLSGKVVTSPALDDSGNVYITTLDGRLIKLEDKNTSANIIWEFKVNSSIESSPVIDSENNIYFGCNNHYIYSVDKDGNLEWKALTKGAVRSTGVIANGKIFIGSDDRILYSLSLSNGDIIWRYYVLSQVHCPLLYESGKIYFGTMNGKIESVLDQENTNIKRLKFNRLPIWGTFQGNNRRTGNQNDVLTYIESDNNRLPISFKLFQNYPNPFNSNTNIKYQLPFYSYIELSIYNCTGQKIQSLIKRFHRAGTYIYHWNSNGLATGVYFIRFSTGKGFVQTRKLILLK